MERKNFLKIENLKSGYSKKMIINDISFEIAKGSFTGIIGPNGSGKTTLFKTITGELVQTKGSIFLNENCISTMKSKQKAQKIAIVTQNTDAVDISVEDYVLMGRYPYKGKFQLFDTQDDIKLAIKFMKLTGVYKFKDKLMNELSGGEQQLVAIAKALTQEPELLLLDEPTSHLDISHQMQILNLIQKLNEDYNLTVLMIIHDLNLAAEYCDYLIMMDHGDIFVKGTPEEVLTYTNIEEVFKAIVITQENRITKKPSILLVSDRTYKQI
ncbi:MAG: ABC transporter ATP-binding protein [Flavobacteriaceae bacterium]|nr:ABC transporter ATP-binding protein [Flavobacteriaceae bacterium]